MGGKYRVISIALGASVAFTAIGIYAQPASATVTLSAWLKYKYPAQAKATQNNSIAVTKRWALLIGINDYASPTVDNVGSRQDAESLYYLLTKRLGWRTDHIILLRDRDATAQHILDTIHWLRLKSNGYSVVVFHYAGHENHTRTLADGDNESMDVEIWAADNRYILDGVLGREFGYIRANRMWIDISTCRASGFSDAGMIKPGRILTYSSYPGQYSYESPGLHHSVFGWYMIVDAMLSRYADTNHDGKVTVEEAFYWSKPYVLKFTANRQTPFMNDQVPGNMFLNVS